MAHLLTTRTAITTGMKISTAVKTITLAITTTTNNKDNNDHHHFFFFVVRSDVATILYQKCGRASHKGV